jgi:hypothetical protein
MNWSAFDRLMTRVTEAPRPEDMVTLEEQLEQFEHHAMDIIEALAASLTDPVIVADIISLARERLIDGHAAYGDRMFHKHDDELTLETFEELADAVNWSLPIRANACFDCNAYTECFD